MPRTILTHPPGGATGKVRNRYAVVQKICLLEEAACLPWESNLSLQGVAVKLGVQHSLLVKWTKDLHRLQSNPRSKKRSRFAGPNGILHSIEHELLMDLFSTQAGDQHQEQFRPPKGVVFAPKVLWHQES